MEDMNFCPFCDAPQHKILHYRNLVFCKDCNKFFKLEMLDMNCPKCEKPGFTISDFPGPNGEIVFQCKSCKKMFSAKEFFEYNNIK